MRGYVYYFEGREANVEDVSIIACFSHIVHSDFILALPNLKVT